MKEINLTVAPYLGAWIEMPVLSSIFSTAVVAPYLGVWIEIIWQLIPRKMRMSNRDHKPEGYKQQLIAI